MPWRRWLAPPTRFVLVVGNEGGLLLRLVGDQVVGQWSVSSQDETALTALAAPLAAAPRTPVMVLVDLLEQAYRRESIPKVNPLDRAKVLRRRLQRAFPDAALRAALRLGANGADGSTGEARAQEYLFAAVPNGAEWDRWATFLRQLDNPVTALALLPVEATRLVTRLAKALTPDDAEPSPWTILIGQQRTGGFRQIVANDGHLALTRLTPSLPRKSAAADLAAEIGRELKATLGYMTRLGYRPGRSLDLVVLGPDALRSHLDDLALAGARLHVVTAEAAAQALGLAVPDPIEVGDGALLAALFAARHRRPAMQLLPPDLRNRMLQVMGLRWASAGLATTALGLISYSALSAVGGLQMEQEIDWLTAWRGTTSARLERRADETERVGRQAEAIRLLLDAERRLQADRQDPFAGLEALRGALTSDQRLLAVTWAVNRPAAGPRRRRAEPGALSFTLDLTLDLGHLEQPRAAVAATDDLLARLGEAFPDQPLRVARHAVDILPNQAFVGGAGDGRGARAEPLSAEIRIGAPTP